MSIIQAIILGLVQGLTEFIPVSSSGHLVIMHRLLGVTESGLTFDVALHMGTIAALLIFFHKDIIILTRALVHKDKHTKLAWLIVVATVPAVIVGFLLEGAAETSFRSVRLVAFNLLLMGAIMLLAEKISHKISRRTSVDKISLKQALGVGIAQSLAIVPGVSRSGVTITAGLFAGMDRVAATRFSFLLAIPITVGAVVKVLASGDIVTQVSNEKAIFVAGILSALVSGLFAIKFLLAYLSRHSLAAFAYYRFALALAVLLWFSR